MTIYAATDGSDGFGFAVFDFWSDKSEKNDANVTISKWQALHSCPPDQLTVATVFFNADQACPRWRTLVRDRDGTVEDQMTAVAEESRRLLH